MAIAVGLVTVLGAFGLIRLQSSDSPSAPPPTQPPQPTVNPSRSGTASIRAPSASSKAGYIRAADQVCTKRLAEVERMSSSTDTDSIEWKHGFVALLRSMLREWRVLTPPSGDEAEVDSVIDAMAQDAAAFEKALRALEAGDIDVLTFQQLVDQAGQDDAAVKQRARTYGFRVCGEYD